MTTFTDQPDLQNCVTCPGCAFRFGAEHVDTNSDAAGAFYTCPVCQLASIETEAARVRRTSDAHRERALADVLNERGRVGPTSVTVETGSDGVCVVTLTMDELDWLTTEAQHGVFHDDVCEWTFEEDDAA